jgi:hypothetical protein
MKRELTPVPPDYNSISDKCIRENATSRIVWHGRDAEAWTMDQAKEFAATGQTAGVENSMRMVREIRRQLAGPGGAKLLEQHYECARQIAEGEKRDAAKKNEIADRIAAADSRARGGR